jgi:hypothetical protein
VNIRFLADADLNQAIVKGVRDREPSLDLMSATEARLEGLADRDVLTFAAAQNRVLISHDTSTMPVHFADSWRQAPIAREFCSFVSALPWAKLSKQF